MRFGILGPVEVRTAEGDPVAIGGSRLRALLALLLLDAGRVVDTHRLIGGLYGTRPPHHGPNALEGQVARLRRKLRSPTELIESHPSGYRIAVDRDDVDVHQFSRLAETGRSTLSAGDPAGAVATLREALALWRGPALADLRGQSLLEPLAERLDEQRIAAFADRVDAGLLLGEHAAMIDELRRMVDAHPFAERLRVQLMRALSGSGRQAEALEVFADARRRLAEELGARPSKELVDARLALLCGDRRAERCVLPAPLTSLLGREDDLAGVAELLRAARMVTVTGSAGVGKTRLAIETASRDGDEVCFTDLTPATGQTVIRAVFDALGLRDGGLLAAPDVREPADRLIAALADRPMLLVLDGCEHVIAETARLAHRLLATCPALRILVTSRVALGVAGETLFPLSPLALPAEGAGFTEAAGAPSVRLFAERAAVAAPAFALTETTMAPVTRICRNLDGLAPAIELTAAKARAMPVEEIADWLGSLTARDPSPPGRDRTLRTVLEWSWRLLDDREQALARRLAVFTGSASPAAVDRVCGIPDAGEPLGRLTDKAIVSCDPGSGRYRMLDTVRAFAEERLADAGEADALRRAHAEFVLDLACLADPRLRRADQLVWLDRLRDEHDNLLAALRWAVTGDPALALRLIAALTGYWFLSGSRGDVAPLAAELLGALGAQPPDGLAEEYVLCVLHAAGHNRAIVEPGALAAAESIMAGMTAPARQPFLTVLWAITFGPRPPGKRPEDGDPWTVALGRLGEGMLRFDRSEPGAEGELRAALAGFRAVGDRWGAAKTLDVLGALADRRGDHADALAHTGAAIALAGEFGAMEDLAELRCRRGDQLVRAGDLGAACVDFTAAAELARTTGLPLTGANAQRGLGDVARLDGDVTAARRRYECALALAGDGRAGAGVRSQVLSAFGSLAEAEADLAETGRERQGTGRTGSVR